MMNFALKTRNYVLKYAFCISNDEFSKVRDDRALVLTTHSMEEADALCSNIGIMIRGQLRALGSSQELKSGAISIEESSFPIEES